MGQRSDHRPLSSANGRALLTAVGGVIIGIVTVALLKALDASTLGLAIGVISAGALGAAFAYWILSRPTPPPE